MTRYRYVRAWGAMMGSNQDYVEQQVRKAEADHAPEDATFWSTDAKRWRTFAECPSFETKHTLGIIMREAGWET